jgi:MYXO-CTERM domain-containing protein
MKLGWIVAVVCAGPGSARAQWDSEKTMTNTGSDVWGEGIATSGSTVHMIYGTGVVMYRSSADEGATWSNEKQIGTGTLHLTDPIWADGSDVWVIYLGDIQNKTDWCCSRDLGNIYLLHSGDGGQTWDRPKQLTTSAQAYRVSMTFDSGKLHIVWMDFRSSAWDVYYLRSLDHGANWDPESKIATSAGTFGAERPQIAARGDSVHVTIWDDRGTNPPCMAGPTFSFNVCPDTWYMASYDGGTTWGTEVNVANSGAAIAGRNDIAVAGSSSVALAFNRSAQNSADNNPHVFTIHSPDDGKTWDPPIQLTTTTGQADHGSIIGSGSNVYLAWHDSRAGFLQIYYVQSKTEGASWDTPELASTNTMMDASTPLDAVTPSYVHLVWLDHSSGTWQVHYRRRTVPAAQAGDGVFGDDAGLDGGTKPGGCGCASSDGSDAIAPTILVGLALLRRRSTRAAARRA